MLWTSGGIVLVALVVLGLLFIHRPTGGWGANGRAWWDDAFWMDATFALVNGLLVLAGVGAAIHVYRRQKQDASDLAMRERRVATTVGLIPQLLRVEQILLSHIVMLDLRLHSRDNWMNLYERENIAESDYNLDRYHLIAAFNPQLSSDLLTLILTAERLGSLAFQPIHRWDEGIPPSEEWRSKWLAYARDVQKELQQLPVKIEKWQYSGEYTPVRFKTTLSISELSEEKREWEARQGILPGFEDIGKALPEASGDTPEDFGDTERVPEGF